MWKTVRPALAVALIAAASAPARCEAPTRPLSAPPASLPLRIGSDGGLFVPFDGRSVRLVNRDGDTMLGPLRAPFLIGAPGGAVQNEYSHVPPTFAAMSGGGPLISVALAGGHVPGDTMRGALVSQTDTIVGPEAQEGAAIIELRAKTGAVKGYAHSTAYLVGDYVHSPDHSQTYVVTRAGVSAAAGEGPSFCPRAAPDAQCRLGQPNASLGSDGGVGLKWYTPGINDGKSAQLVSVSRDRGGGNVWGNATNVSINWLPQVGGNAYNHELDTSNNGRDCPPFTPGGCFVVGVSVVGGGTFPGTIGFQGTAGNYPAAAAWHVGMYLGNGFASDVGVFQDTNAAVGTQDSGTNKAVSVYNTAKAPIGVKLAGTYAGSAIDTTEASTSFAMNAGPRQRICLDAGDGCWTYNPDLRDMSFGINGVNIIQLIDGSPEIRLIPNEKLSFKSGDWSLAYESAPGVLALSIGGRRSWFVDKTGSQHAATYYERLSTPSSSSAPCVAGQFTDDANYHYVCVADNTWKRVALSSF